MTAASAGMHQTGVALAMMRVSGSGPFETASTTMRYHRGGVPNHAAVRLREERNERCDGAAEQSALAADHLSGGDRRQRLFKCFLSTPVVRPAPVMYPLSDR